MQAPPPVFQEIKRLNEHYNILFSLKFTSRIVFIQNIRSRNEHYGDVIGDPLILHSEILVLQETMTKSNDIFNIHGHFPGCRVDGNARTPRSRILIYLRNPAKCHLD